MDSTDYDFSILDQFDVPPAMSKEFLGDMIKRHPEKLAKDDPATYEFMKEG